MPSLKDIKNQIKSVKNTEKTTKAMKLVSNVKLKKAQEAARQSRAYANKIDEVLSDISSRIKQYKTLGFDNRFFNNNIKISTIDLIFITSDKGLCGGFNVQTIKATKKFIQEQTAQGIKVRLRAIGKKGLEYFNFQGVEILKSYIGVSSSPNYEKAQTIINEAIDDFVSGNSDKIVLIYNGYKSMIAQEVRYNNLAPIPTNEILKDKISSILEVEPSDEEEAVLEELTKKYFEYSMYYSLVDSLAAEHSARMQAMDNATNNAKERVSQLNLKYNKARQSSITTELIEIISGVESMK